MTRNHFMNRKDLKFPESDQSTIYRSTFVILLSYVCWFVARALPAGFKHRLSETHPDIYQKLEKATPSKFQIRCNTCIWTREVVYRWGGGACWSGSLDVAYVSRWLWMCVWVPGSTYTTLISRLQWKSATSHNSSLRHQSSCHITPTILAQEVYSVVECPYVTVTSLTLRSVHLCGFWNLQPSLYSTPDSSVTTLLSSVPDPLLYVGFGSMESFLPDVDWTSFFTILDKGEYSTNICVFQCLLSSSRDARNVCTVPMSRKWPHL